jgi:hypothetical protein
VTASLVDKTAAAVSSVHVDTTTLELLLADAAEDVAVTVVGDCAATRGFISG